MVSEWADVVPNEVYGLMQFLNELMWFLNAAPEWAH